VFISNQYAFSIRVFPTDPNANEIEAFSDGGTTHAAFVQAWSLNPSQINTAVLSPATNSNIKIYAIGDNLNYKNVPSHSEITVYNLWGQKISSQCSDIDSGQIKLSGNQIYIVEIKGDNVFFSTKVLLSNRN
jgi:hypothetical protein